MRSVSARTWSLINKDFEALIGISFLFAPLRISHGFTHENFHIAGAPTVVVASWPRELFFLIEFLI